MFPRSLSSVPLYTIHNTQRRVLKCSSFNILFSMNLIQERRVKMKEDLIEMKLKENKRKSEQ